jgi:hypothetical protein
VPPNTPRIPTLGGLDACQEVQLPVRIAQLIRWYAHEIQHCQVEVAQWSSLLENDMLTGLNLPGGIAHHQRGAMVVIMNIGICQACAIHRCCVVEHGARAVGR